MLCIPWYVYFSSGHCCDHRSQIKQTSTVDSNFIIVSASTLHHINPQSSLNIDIPWHLTIIDIAKLSSNSITPTNATSVASELQQFVPNFQNPGLNAKIIRPDVLIALQTGLPFVFFPGS